MAIYEFPAIFTKEEDGKYSVDFPDLEGCYTSGDNLNDAIAMAHDVLAIVLGFYKRNGKDIPVACMDRAILPLKKNQDVYVVTVDFKDKNYISEDPVNHPSHYEKQCSLECIDVMEACFDYDAVFDFCVCNAFKYLWRHKFKNGEEDMMKAAWYIDKAEQIMDETGDEEHLNNKLIRIRDLYEKIMRKNAEKE